MLLATALLRAQKAKRDLGPDSRTGTDRFGRLLHRLDTYTKKTTTWRAGDKLSRELFHPGLMLIPIQG